MSWSDRRAFLTLLAGLPACTFTPAYAPGGPADGLQGAIRIAAPTDKNSFDLVERLEDRLGRPQAPRFDLGFKIETQSTGVGYTTGIAITRYHLTGKVDWVLTDDHGVTVAQGTAQSFTAWSATGSTVASLAAEEDAARRLMLILADQIVTRLIAMAGSFQ